MKKVVHVYECGICDSLHLWDFNEDCRDNEQRFGDIQAVCEKFHVTEFEVAVSSMEERIAADMQEIGLRELIVEKINVFARDNNWFDKSNRRWGRLYVYGNHIEDVDLEDLSDSKLLDLLLTIQRYAVFDFGH